MAISATKLPKTLSEALRLAADLIDRNEELERQLEELQSLRFPEVLHSKHILELMGIGSSTLTYWASDPTFPHLDAGRKKGESIKVLKSDFYNWLRNRRGVE